MSTIEEKQLYVAIWSKVVETQMHFNEMSVKARQFGLAFVAAALGLGIVLLTNEGQFYWVIQIGKGVVVHAIVLIIIASALALYAVRILDLNVYHKMLRGAVSFGEDFEENYMKQIFSLEKGMTQSISHFSRHQDAAVRNVGGKNQYWGADKKNAYEKIKQFYNISILVLLVSAVGLFAMTNLGDFDHTKPPQAKTEAAQ